MNWKKNSIWGACILILCFFTDLGVKIWLKNSLPDFIKEKNDTPYNFSYSDASYSLFQRKMTISDIVISPKAHGKGIYTIKVGGIIIHNVHFLTFLTEKDLIANLIEINKPDIVIHQNRDSINRKKEIKPYKLGNSIQIQNFVISEGKLQLYNVNKKKIASLKNLDLHLSGITWDMVNVKKRIPITYKKAEFKIDSIFYQINELHHLNLKNISFKNDSIVAQNVWITPNITEQKFYTDPQIHKSLMDIKIPIAKIKKLDWGYNKGGLFYVNSSKIEVDSTSIKILGKTAPFTQNKEAVTYINRIIPFDLHIDSIQILKSKLNLNNQVTSENTNILIKKINNKVDDEITVEQLKLYDNLLVIQATKNSSIGNKPNFTYFFDDLLKINNFSIQSSTIKYYNANKVNILNLSNIYYNLNNITINTLISSSKKELPFTYSSYSLTADSIFYTAIRNYSFKALHINLTNDVFAANKLQIIPKISPNKFAQLNLGKNLFKINIEKFLIPKINWGIQNNKFIIKAPNILVSKMNTWIYQNRKAKRQSNTIHVNNKDLGTDVSIDNFKLSESTIQCYDALLGNKITSLENVNLNIKHIIVLNKNSKNYLGLPFSFSEFYLSGNKIYYDMGFHIMKIKDILFTNKSFTLSNLEIQPKKSKQNIMRRKGIDAYSIFIADLKIPNLDLGFPNKEFQFVAPLVSIDNLKTTIHQYDIPSSSYIPVYKPLFSEKLRNLKFKLQLKEIRLKNSYLAYEEESLDKGTGKIYFSDINSLMKNINSGYKASSLPNVMVNFRSNFMGSAQFSADWVFNVLNKEDAFTINGNITYLPLEKIDMFIRPYLHISTQGMLDMVVFDFNGNNSIGNGTFGMEYQDIDVTIFKKNGKEKQKLLSNIANLAIKENSEDSVRIQKIKKIERTQDKSFFNFLWKMTLSGLKSSISRF